MACCIRPATGLATGLVACLLLAAPTRADDVRDLVNERMGLRASAIVQLDAVYPREQPIRAAIAYEGEQYTLDLRPFSVRAENYQVFTVGDDGVLTPAPPAPVNTLRGVVVGMPGSRVSASVSDDGLQAVVSPGDGSRFWVEPIARRTGLMPDGRHVIYRDDEVLPSGGVCLAQEMGGGLIPAPWEYPRRGNPIDGGGGGGGGGGGPGQPIDEAELAIDADYPYYLDWGTATEDRINSVINTVNMQFEDEVSITHTITSIVIRTSLAGDPYSTTSPGGLLGQFRNHWLVNHADLPRDVAHLFTGRELDGNVIGIAWGLGLICSDAAFCVSQSDCCASFGCATDLTAHELGHLWNANHCTCQGPDYTMNPFITCANTFNPDETVPEMAVHRDSRNCLNVSSLQGACCFGNASCVAPVLATNCIASGGIFQGPNSVCGLALCANVGACCLPGGGCQTLSQADCTSVAGTYQGDGHLCGAGACTTIGVCCVGADCQLVDETGCATLGGTFGGAGTICVAGICSGDQGACCFGDGACQAELEDECVQAGGTFLGAGTGCTTATCDGPGCREDFDGSGAVGFADMNQLLTAWGPCAGCPEDLSGDGAVGFADMSQLLTVWGPCTP